MQPQLGMEPTAPAYYQSGELSSSHQPKPSTRRPPSLSPPSRRAISPTRAGANDSGGVHRPLEPLVPPSVAAEREELERQRAWRSARWNELHFHHRESLVKELERRILLLIWVTVELVTQQLHIAGVLHRGRCAHFDG